MTLGTLQHPCQYQDSRFKIQKYLFLSEILLLPMYQARMGLSLTPLVSGKDHRHLWIESAHHSFCCLIELLLGSPLHISNIMSMKEGLT